MTDVPPPARYIQDPPTKNTGATILGNVDIVPTLGREGKTVPDWPYFVFWGSAVTGLMLLAFAIVLELRAIRQLLLEGL